MKPSAEQFEKLALDQLDTLYRVANRLTRDAERAGDLVQETYLRAFRSRDSFDLKDHGMRPWLLRILRNLHLSKVDREKRQPVSVDGDVLDSLNSTGTAPAGGGTRGGGDDDTPPPRPSTLPSPRAGRRGSGSIPTTSTSA